MSMRWPMWVVVLSLSLIALPGVAQKGSEPMQSEAGGRRTRLILKDGSYQVVMRYRVDGGVVRFVSAERGGATEEIPVALVDLEATRRYEAAHTVQGAGADEQQGRPPALDPELLKEEAEQASLTPEVAPDLRLDTEDAVIILDTFQGTPELVPLAQTGGDLNKTTGHTFLRGTVNPLSSSHQIVQIRGSRAAVQAHVDTPLIFVRVGDEAVSSSGGTPLVVDTHGANYEAVKGEKAKASASRYVIVRADVRRDVRNLMSFQIGALGGVKRQEDVVETRPEVLPGGHWVRLTPIQGLAFGEYALMEVTSEREVNLGVWDFGVHPTAPENRDALHPEARRPASLERRQRD